MTTQEAEQIAAQLGWTDREDYTDLTRRGLAVYESKLKASLEPEYGLAARILASEMRVRAGATTPP